MAKINYTNALKNEYENLFKSCEITSSKFSEVDALCQSLLANKNRYEQVVQELKIPWYLVAVIHNMESSQNFTRHLHNGDSLNARTTHVPAGRPSMGTPPFTWEQSASDALKYRNLHRIGTWDLTRVLYEIEGYNGWGYRLYHAHVLSPYLWSYSNHYVSGKYIADGRWSDTAKSKQCGAIVLLRRLEEMGAINFDSTVQADKPIFIYATSVLPHGEEIQRFVNNYDGISVRVDGWPGEKTSDAVKKLFGFYLKGDPRS
ncbi:MAG: hypothetical protein U9N30_06310 [Campylobacterota bacterium]|nr:hypothetical protein [Campylobacterota bacterium]